MYSPFNLIETDVKQIKKNINLNSSIFDCLLNVYWMAKIKFSSHGTKSSKKI